MTEPNHYESHEPICINCRHFRLVAPDRPEHQDGTCHEGPPTPVVAHNGIRSVFPPMEPDDGCDRFSFRIDSDDNK